VKFLALNSIDAVDNAVVLHLFEPLDKYIVAGFPVDHTDESRLTCFLWQKVDLGRS
jgi:hypothetical protein